MLSTTNPKSPPQVFVCFPTRLCSPFLPVLFRNYHHPDSSYEKDLNPRRTMAFLRRLVAPATQHLHPRCLTASRGTGAPSNQSSLHPEALGFSSPGNTGISQEMKEAGQPQKDRENDEATHRHNYSEKMRFDNQMYSNAETVGKSTTAADAGDTGPERTIPETGEDKTQTSQPQTKVGSDEEKTAERVQKKESNTKPTDEETNRHVIDYSR